MTITAPGLAVFAVGAQEYTHTPLSARVRRRFNWAVLSLAFAGNERHWLYRCRVLSYSADLLVGVEAHRFIEVMEK